MMGIIHSIMVWLDCCRGSMEGVVVIFCWSHVEAPTISGIMNSSGVGLAARSKPRKCWFKGAAACTGNNGIHEYSFAERFTRSSGLVYKVWISTWNSPKRMGICTTSGPRHPTGLTPDSLYSFMVSWDWRARSLEKRVWISRILGCRLVMACIWWICFRDRGRVTSRTRAVKAMMATPMLLKQRTYNTTRVLSMGRMMTSFQRRETVSKPALPRNQRPAPGC